MRQSIMIAGLLAGWLASSAFSSPAKPGVGDAAPGTSVEMPYLIAPLMNGDSLVAYAYVSCKIIASSQSAAIDIRDRIPFIQDAFVRDVNRATVGRGDEPPTVDPTSLTARLLADARKVMPLGEVAGVRLIQIQISLLRPGTAPPGGPS
jgi:hypothetical protein